MKVDFLEQAYYEYLEAIEYYDIQSSGLGKKFVEEVDRTIKIICKYPDGFTKYSLNTKKAILNIFPYNIIYSVINETILIVAIAHQHRKPKYWDKR